mmetsp:Transcript_11818/g.30374  ORF Transcript_11818/g.30374 Transcript_11818/m.30374 type:complete len:588 (+) Transcript_11818:168-1931(+)
MGVKGRGEGSFAAMGQQAEVSDGMLPQAEAEAPAEMEALLVNHSPSLHTPTSARPFGQQGRVCRWWLRARNGWAKATNDVPLSLLVMFALQAWMQTFPLTAYSGFLYTELKLSNPEINTYESLSFLPYCFKPLYALVSDKLPLKGSHRTSYIRLCAVVSAVCYVVTATVIRTPAALFGVTFVRTTANAALELIFGVLLADVSCRNPANAGAIQGAANAARNLGSVLAYAVGLAIFPPSGGQRISNTHAIGVTALFPVAIFGLCSWIPRDAGPTEGRGGRPDVSPLPVLWLMPLIVWAQLSDDNFGVPPDLWWKVMVGLGAITFFSPVVAAWLYHGSAAGVTRTVAAQPISFGVAAYVLLFNAVPSDDAPVGVYQYDAFSDNEYYTQYMGLVQYSLSFVLCVLYGVLLSGRRTSIVLAACVVLSGATRLAFLWFTYYRARHPADLRGAFGVLSGVLAVKQVGSELALVAALTLVTQFSDHAGKPGVLYAIYLSFFDLGDVAGVQLSTQLGYAVIGRSAYTTAEPLSNANLGAIIKAAAACQICSVVFVVLVVVARRPPPARHDSEADPTVREVVRGSLDEKMPLLQNE